VTEEDNAVRGGYILVEIFLGGKAVCRAYCRHAKHAFSRRVWGHAPPGKFEKLDALRLNLRPFSLKEVTICELYIFCL